MDPTRVDVAVLIGLIAVVLAIANREGPAGAAGPQGTQGPSGGPQGSQGPTGGSGPQGDTGPQGFGPQGNTGAQGPQGTAGATTPYVYGSFIYTSDAVWVPAHNADPPRAIQYTARTGGTLTIGGGFPGTAVQIPTTGTYRVLFSAQVQSTGLHTLQVWAVINQTTVPDSNTHISVPSSTKACLTVEFFFDMQANDTLELFTYADSANIVLVTLPGLPVGKIPSIPVSPAIILNVQQIA